MTLLTLPPAHPRLSRVSCSLLTAGSPLRRRATPRSPANSTARLPLLGGGGGCCCCRRAIPPPLPRLVSRRLRRWPPPLRSAPSSAARTAPALDFGQINFQVWERSGSHGSSSYSPPPPPPPVPRCRGCRRGCPSPLRSRRASLSARPFPTATFLPGPPFFCKSEGGDGVGRDFPPPPPLFPLLSRYKLPGSRAEPPPPAPSPRAAPPSPPQVAASRGGGCLPPPVPGRRSHPMAGSRR